MKKRADVPELPTASNAKINSDKLTANAIITAKSTATADKTTNNATRSNPAARPTTINKTRRPVDAETKVEMNKVAVETDREKKTRRSIQKQQAFDTNQSKSGECIDNPYAIGMSGPRLSVPVAPVDKQRRSVLSKSRQSVTSEIEGSDVSHLSNTSTSLNTRRPSLNLDQADTILEVTNATLAPVIQGRRRSLAPGDIFPEVVASQSLRSERRRSLIPGEVPNDGVLSMSLGGPGSRRASSVALNSNSQINGSMVHMEERSMSERQKQSLLMKEASNIINTPQRVFPGNLMEKYSSKRAASLGSQVASLEPENVFIPSQDLPAKIVEQSESLIQSSSVPQISKAKRLWNKAYCHTVSGLRFISLYKELRAKGMNIQRAKALEAEGLAVLLSASNNSKLDPNISAKIKELTSKEDRSDEEIEALERILSIKNRAFGRFTLDQRLKFCKIVKYVSYEGERMIVKEGHVSWAFYFILSGQDYHNISFKVKDNLKYRLNVIGAGTSFGDRTMNMLNDKRTASVASTKDIEMLKIDKTDFFDITNVRDEKGMANRSAKILQIPHFSTAPGGFVERITPFVQVITYEPNEYIINEGVECNKIFWLLKGTCQVIKMLPFKKKIVNESYAGKNVQVSPFIAGQTVLEPDEEFLYEFVTTQEVDVGQNFVDFPVPTGGSLTEHCFYVNKKDYMEQIRKEDPGDLNNKAAVSIFAKTKVEVICINRIDYALLASTDMILLLINSKDIYRIPLLQLQESYLTTRKWNAHKKKVIADVVTKIKLNAVANQKLKKKKILMRTFLSQKIAQSIDMDLMDPNIGGFAIEQLMELAGLCCAQVIFKEYNVGQFKNILVCAGPGNNGGDALVAARHLSHFGYCPSVICPKIPEKPLFQNLVTQCNNLNIPFLDGPISRHFLNQSLILDGIFGFSFKGPIRAPFDEMISSLKSCKIPIVSIDIPSGWDVELGNTDGIGLEPSLLISLTYPKKCASKFMGKHYIGGRFLPDFIAKKYSICAPSFPNADQFVEIQELLE